jgi:hypothetical protein
MHTEASATHVLYLDVISYIVFVDAVATGAVPAWANHPRIRSGIPLRHPFGRGTFLALWHV